MNAKSEEFRDKLQSQISTMIEKHKDSASGYQHRQAQLMENNEKYAKTIQKQSE